MNFSYDKKANSFAIVINPGGGVVRDEEVAPNVFIGYAKDGSVTEIQIMDISQMKNHQLTPADFEKLKKTPD